MNTSSMIWALMMISMAGLAAAKNEAHAAETEWKKFESKYEAVLNINSETVSCEKNTLWLQVEKDRYNFSKTFLFKKFQTPAECYQAALGVFRQSSPMPVTLIEKGEARDYWDPACADGYDDHRRCSGYERQARNIEYFANVVGLKFTVQEE